MQDEGLEGMVLGFNPALGLRLYGRTPKVCHPPIVQIYRQFACDVKGAIIAEHSQFVVKFYAIAASAMSMLSGTSPAFIKPQSLQPTT